MTLKNSPNESCKNASVNCESSLYDEFLARLIEQHTHQREFNIDCLIELYFSMSSLSKFEQLDRLKSWLDSFRPLSPIIVEELKKLYDVQFGSKPKVSEHKYYEAEKELLR